MALWAFSHILLGIIEHLGPVVPLVNYLIGKGASSFVVSTVIIMNFLYHFSSLVRTKAS